MSQQIDTALVQSYANAIELGIQQKMSKLEGAVMHQVQNSEYDYHDRITSTSMQALTTRHADTVYTDTPHSRRRIGLQHFTVADLIDDKDKLQMNADPTSPYIANFVAAANRQTDQLIIDAFDADVYTGKTGSTSVTFANDGGSTVAVDYVESGSAADSNLTVGKLRKARQTLMENEADEDELFFVGSPSQLNALLRTTDVTSADYNTVKALVNGEVNQFMGFNFIWSNRLDIDSNNVRDCYAFSKSAMKLVTAKAPEVKVDEMPGKNYAVQVFMCYSANALRLWGEKVVKVLADEDL